MFKYYPAKAPAPSIEALFKQYKQIFSKLPVAPETLSIQQRPVINIKEVLVEVPTEKQGIPPNKQIWIHKGKNADNTSSPQKIKLFQSCGLNEDPTKKVWYYKDGNNQPQGPHTNREMDILLAQSKIDMNTRVALDSLEKFVKIEKIQKIVDSQAQIPQVPQKKEVKREHPIMEPFRNSNLTENFDQKVWFYKLATNNDLIGPLSTWDMDKFWQTMIVSEDTRIAFESTNKFVKMEKILNLAQNQLNRLKEEEKRRQDEEKKIQEQNERDALDIDYSKIPNVEIGQWGEEQKNTKGPIKVNVVKAVQIKSRDAGKLKSRGGEDQNKKVVNKSMQVEGHYGNLYDKQGSSALQGKVQKRNEAPYEQKKKQELVLIEEEQKEETQLQEKKPVPQKYIEQQKPKQEQIQEQTKVIVEQVKTVDQKQPKVEQKQQPIERKSDKKEMVEKKQEVKNQEKKDVIEKNEVEVVPQKEVVEKKEVVVQNVIEKVEKKQEQEEDEWQQVTVQKSQKKKQKKGTNPIIPGLDPRVHQRGGGQQKKEVKPIVVVVNSQQQQVQQSNNDDDDEWLEVTKK